jgi:hypothetical protein
MVFMGKLEGKRPLGRPRHIWEDIIKVIFSKWDVGAWTGSVWFRTEQVAGTCECGNELSGFH